MAGVAAAAGEQEQGGKVAKNPLAEEVAAELVPLGPVRTRHWFGATALVIDEVQFGFVWDGQLYLRVDAAGHERAAAAGMKLFTVSDNNGRTMTMRHYRGVPPAVVADPDALREWATTAMAEATAAARAKGAKSRRRVGPPEGL